MNNAGRFFVFILIVIFFMFFVLNFYSSNIKKSNNGQKASSLSLEKAVQNGLEGSKGIYAVAIRSLSSKDSYYLNEHRIFKAGSLYKLWIMSEAFNQIQEGLLKEDEVLNQDVSVLNEEFNIPQDQAELTEGSISLSAGSALNQMISISHNYAALLLTEKLKLSSIDAFLKRNGFNETRVGTHGEDPTTTASDIALFFEKLYKGELANSENTEKMLNLLKNQQLNDKLPKYLPKDLILAHKTGEFEYTSHDAGIVYGPKGDYVISILSDTDLPASAEDRIAKISQEVYQYFSK